jgi:hypothetical protein
MGSSDINYSLKSNFPFYTEQYDIAADQSLIAKAMPAIEEPEGNPGEAANAVSKGFEIEVGASKGRRYPKNVERPGFIHPSPEPMKASMEKQKELREEIRALVNLAVASLDSRQSAESKREDNRGLEAGLSYIGMKLELAERHIADLWHQYEGKDNDTHITYPNDYSLKSDAQRIEEAGSLAERRDQINSITYRRELSKQMVRLTLGRKADGEKLDTIYKEIDTMVTITKDSETVRADHKEGLVSDSTASELAGYAKGEAEQAAKDHAERATRIALAQSKVSKMDPEDVRDPEKETDPTLKGDPRKTGVRGKGK